MIYDPKEIEKWQKIQKSKDGLGIMESLLKAGKMNRSDIPIIRSLIRHAKDEDGAERIIERLKRIVLSIEQEEYA
jgi:hypothetical protein